MSEGHDISSVQNRLDKMQIPVTVTCADVGYSGDMLVSAEDNDTGEVMSVLTGYPRERRHHPRGKQARAAMAKQIAGMHLRKTPEFAALCVSIDAALHNAGVQAYVEKFAEWSGQSVGCLAAVFSQENGNAREHIGDVFIKSADDPSIATLIELARARGEYKR